MSGFAEGSGHNWTTETKVTRPTTLNKGQLYTQGTVKNQKCLQKAKGCGVEQNINGRLHFLDLPAFSQDNMMRALGEKVSEVYRCCVGDGSSSHSTLEKLASIEKQMSLLLHCLEDIPKASLETMQKIKESERRTRYVFCNRGLQPCLEQNIDI